MHSVIIIPKPSKLTLLCFLVLTLASTSWRSCTWGASATLSSSSDSVHLSSTPKTTTATGLDRLKEALIAEDDDKENKNDASKEQPEAKKVKYASGLWLTASKINTRSGSSRKKRSLNHSHHSPWKNSISRRSRLQSSASSAAAAASMSEQNSVPSSQQPQMSDHLRAAGREMAVQMMSKRRGGMSGGRMYDVPQIGKNKKPVARHLIN